MIEGAWRWLARITLIIGGIGLGILFGIELDAASHWLMR
jgi:hypothetical protein